MVLGCGKVRVAHLWFLDVGVNVVRTEQQPWYKVAGQFTGAAIEVALDPADVVPQLRPIGLEHALEVQAHVVAVDGCEIHLQIQ